MKSIAFSSIPQNEKEQAVKEWAEGNSHMEKWLWTCINNGIETTGCHADGTHPYLDIRVNNLHDKVRKMLHVAQEIEGTQILVNPDGGNPFGDPNWDKPDLSFGFFSVTDEKSANDIFDKMSESLTTENTKYKPENEVFAHMLDFYDFFAGKESELDFRMKYISGQYNFSIEPYKSNKNLAYITNLLEKAGLKRMEERADIPIEEYKIVASTLEEFNDKMIKCKNIVMSEWSLEPPHEIKEGMMFNTIARIKKREFGDTQQGQEQFEEWLQNEYDKMKQRSNGDQNGMRNEQNKSIWDKVKNKVMGFLSKFKGKNDTLALPQLDKNIKSSDEHQSFENRLSNDGEFKGINTQVTQIAQDTQTIGQPTQEKEI